MLKRIANGSAAVGPSAFGIDSPATCGSIKDGYSAVTDYCLHGRRCMPVLMAVYAMLLEQLNLSAGRGVAIEGTVNVVTKATPDSRLTTDWGLSSRDAEMVRRRGLFLRASRIAASPG
jgi:hypothetical protein